MIKRMLNRFVRIRTKILIFGLLMSIVPFFLLGTVNIYISKQKLTDSINTTNKLFVEDGVNQLETIVSHTFQTMNVLRDSMASYSPTGDEEDEYYLFSSFLKNIPYAENVTRYDERGKERFKVDRWSLVTSQDLGIIKNNELLANTRLGKTYISPVMMNKNGKMVVSLAIPRYGASGRTGGILVEINLGQLFDVLISRARHNASSLYVMDQNGKPIVQSGFSSVIDSSGVYEQFRTIPLNAAQPVYQMYNTKEGQPVIGYVQRVPSTDWLIVLEQPVDVAFASFKQLQANLLLFTLLIALLVFIISIVFAHIFSRPIEKIERGIQRITNGDLATRIEVKANDEIGSLANSMNEMAEKLKERTEEVIEEKKRLDLVVSGMGMGLVLIDENFHVSWTNGKMEEWYGEKYGYIGDLCADAERENCDVCKECSVIVRQMATGDERERISSRTDKNGDKRFYRHQIFKISPEKERSPYLEVIEDVTEKRKMEMTMVQADKLAAIGLLASGIAHEINNPLGILSIYAEDLKDRTQEENLVDLAADGEIERYLDTMSEQVMRCKNITSQILNFSRQSSSNSESVDIHQTIDNTLVLLQHEVKKEQVNVNKQFEADSPIVHVPGGEIQQVLLNLLKNAVDAVNGNGTIWIQTRNLSDDEIVVEVKDNGTGIAAADLPRIFDPFFTTKPPGKGTGLGLSICYGIVKRFGGSIQLSSQPGSGTTVEIRLPKSNGGEAHAF
ncbi:PAS domain-containing sensor histidine kinase [Aneurinibacillus terranovensis]|uniref:PAS domain-containing sensor histidine kinase n=1 Tax=Aneurinibacillus terranovensis TaxID=278991 RepID=UPI0004079C7D|nr:PAS domain-containing sensor histidine kinase [Aneurinibacillus terranovensis]